jgi:hypothetical protein
MSFAARLRDSLQIRRSEMIVEVVAGDDLRGILNKHLLAVEAMSDAEIMTSVLLVSADGRRLSHATAPSLPDSYCSRIDGSEIGPSAGSCGTAAFYNKPVYVSDIENDPLWADYRHIALPHGLRSCWSTPIRGPNGEVIGTFAIYRSTVGAPASDEIDAIAMITEHVAEAILLARCSQDLDPPPSLGQRPSPDLRLVHDYSGVGRLATLALLAGRLRSKATELDDLADGNGSANASKLMHEIAELSRALAGSIEHDAPNDEPN